MNTQTSLPTAILSFAFTGVFGPHAKPVGYPPIRAQSAGPFVPYRAQPR